MGIFDNYMDVQKFGMMPGLASMGAGIGSMIGGGNNKGHPMQQANSYWNQIPPEMQKYLGQYMQSGQGAMNGLNAQNQQMVNDPSAMYNKVASGYHQSPGYQWNFDQEMNAANNAAAAGGMAGSPQHQQQAATMASGLANKDFNNYMGHGLGLYGKGLSGMQQMSNQGFQANDQMAQIMQSLMAGQGQNAFNNEVSQQQGKASQYGDIFGGLSAMLPFLMA